MMILVGVAACILVGCLAAGLTQIQSRAVSAVVLVCSIVCVYRL